MTTMRPATTGDIDAVARIWHEGWWDGHAEVVSPELLPHRSLDGFSSRVPDRLADTTVEEVEGAIAGFVMVDGDEADQVYVDRAHRGSGVASRLLAEAARQIFAAGHPVAWLAVVTGNARARRFYEREGWVDVAPLDYGAPIPGGSIPVACRRYELTAPT